MAATKAPTRRQLVEDARHASHNGNWDDAIALNLLLIEKNPRDAEAYNRIGRAHLALRRLQEAREAYQRSLKADPANLIARRNLQRLDQLKNRPETDLTIFADAMPSTAVFIEEVGKTWVDELVNAIDLDLLAEVFPGEKLEMKIEGNRLVVYRNNGQRLGEVEAKTAERVIQLMMGDNKYDIFALGISGHSLRIILREVFRDPKNAQQISFPRQITSRAYLRERDLLRARDESDFFLHDEDDEEEDEANAEPDEEDAYEPEVEASPLDDAIVIHDEEPDMNL
ncbi:MAG: tetratricopeptide repeat protein [Thermomicrobiales bacterium]